VHRIAEVAKTCPLEPMSRTTTDAITTSRSKTETIEYDQHYDEFLYTAKHKKNVRPNFCLYLRQVLTDFENFYTGTLFGQFAIKLLLTISPHPKVSK